MKNRVLCSLIIFFIPLYFVYADIFTAAGVQYEISAANYQSTETFFNEADRIIDSIYREVTPDLIIFPEYIGVFYQLIEYNSVIEGCDTFQEALTAVLAENPNFHSLADVFVMSSETITYLEGWSSLAKRWGVPIVAGSCFTADENGNLQNRTFVFDEDGKLSYQQSKVFLTDFESDIIGLTPGSLDAAGFFQVKGNNIALTICRDTYFREWETKNSEAFLWIDIKANGERYDSEQQQSFMRALPLRMLGSDVDYGMTVCAVGSYLDLFWEGESTAMYKVGDELALADISESYKFEDYIIFKIRMEH